MEVRTRPEEYKRPASLHWKELDGSQGRSESGLVHTNTYSYTSPIVQSRGTTPPGLCPTRISPRLTDRAEEVGSEVVLRVAHDEARLARAGVADDHDFEQRVEGFCSRHGADVDVACVESAVTHTKQTGIHMVARERLACHDSNSQDHNHHFILATYYL